MAFHICCHFPSLSIFLKVNQNMVTVVATAMVSATGSAGKLKDIIFHKYRQDVDQRDKDYDLSEYRQKRAGLGIAESHKSLLTACLQSHYAYHGHVYAQRPAGHFGQFRIVGKDRHKY